MNRIEELAKKPLNQLKADTERLLKTKSAILGRCAVITITKDEQFIFDDYIDHAAAIELKTFADEWDELMKVEG